ncbi:MAG: hypothetical protein PHI90_04980 [Clostridia bacterium]|nr:hypothetical protein [Clostridia bacterium]MDD4048166.1 hypothetical protein [Clostridia bacterium]
MEELTNGNRMEDILVTYEAEIENVVGDYTKQMDEIVETFRNTLNEMSTTLFADMQNMNDKQWQKRCESAKYRIGRIHKDQKEILELKCNEGQSLLKQKKQTNEELVCINNENENEQSNSPIGRVLLEIKESDKKESFKTADRQLDAYCQEKLDKLGSIKDTVINNLYSKSEVQIEVEKGSESRVGGKKISGRGKIINPYIGGNR